MRATYQAGRLAAFFSNAKQSSSSWKHLSFLHELQKRGPTDGFLTLVRCLLEVAAGAVIAGVPVRVLLAASISKNLEFWARRMVCCWSSLRSNSPCAVVREAAWSVAASSAPSRQVVYSARVCCNGNSRPAVSEERKGEVVVVTTLLALS